MAKKKVKKKIGMVDWKKKRWYQIIAPRMLNNHLLGETTVSDPAKLVGKTIKTSLMTLLGDIKKQNYWVKMIVTDVKEGKAHTNVIQYEVSPAAIKRNVRRMRDRIDCSFLCTTKDGFVVRVKPFIVTRSNAKKSVLSVIRKQAREFLTTTIKRDDYSTFINNLLRFKIQFGLKDSLHKVHPVRICEIRVMKLLEKGKVVPKEKSEVKVEEKPKAEKTPEKKVEEKPKAEVKKAPEEKVEEKPKKEVTSEKEVKKDAKTSDKPE